MAIAHGWAKVTGRAMAAAVHANVGLMHAAMAVFNAWCDCAPVLLIGATGPVDPEKRRPWIDWVHTARDQGALVRGYVKWDDQPASPAAAREAVVRGHWIAEAAPQGPVYVNLDAGLQEAPLAAPLPPLDLARLAPALRPTPDPELVRRAAAALAAARRPVILAGRVSRSPAAWQQRVALAEALGARVISCLKLAAAFPTDHPLHAGSPSVWPDAEAAAALQRGRCRSSASTGSTSPGTLAGRVRPRRPLGDGHPGKPGPCAGERLEHGEPRAGAGRHPAARGARRRRGGAARGARRAARWGGSSWQSCRRRGAAAVSPRLRCCGGPGHGAARSRLAAGNRGTPGRAHPSAAVLGRRLLAVPASAGLPGRGGRRRHRLGPRPHGGGGAGAERQRAARRRHLRRRRFPDGRHRAVDRGALSRARC